MKRVHVAVGVIVRANRILISQRPEHVHQGGRWEFPGGKVEPDETVEDGLKRELCEELGILVVRSEPFLQITFDYSEKQVFLDVWMVTKYQGDASGREGQPIAWVRVDELMAYQFPEANAAIVEKIRETFGCKSTKALKH